MALTDKLSAIGTAIREKTGGSELLTLDAMPDEIRGISGGGAEVEPLVLSGDCHYACGGVVASNYIKLFGNTISTVDITNAKYMFYFYDNETIPFNINLKSDSNVSMLSIFDSAYKLKKIPNIEYKGTSYADMNYLFSNCQSLEQVPYIYNANPERLSHLFSNCHRLKEIPDDYFDTWTWDRITSYSYSGLNQMFNCCYSLRKLPKLPSAFENAASSSSSSSLYNSFCNQCSSLDEAIDIPVNTSVNYNANMFSYTFLSIFRIKNIIFRINEDGTPKIANWKNQTIDTTNNVGFATNNYHTTYILNYNSGITADKEVKDDATYQALKNDPDWFTKNITYSRYNHDSAVNTINSLPDTSAYLAANGGTNTIKFKGAAGALTDGGAINTLTEEEIAVATAKGWTITLA